MSNTEIIVLEEAPVIFTKDTVFLGTMQDYVMLPGAILLLPPDAVLVKAPAEKARTK